MSYSITDFNKLAKLGEGTYGVVYKCELKETKQLFAVKKIKEELGAIGVSSTTIREIALLKRLNHPNIICFKQKFISDGQFFLIFEYLSTDLGKYLKQEGGLGSALVKRFSYQIMQALLYCHSMGVLHRDLKPQNLLIDTDNHIIKLADFGLARTYCPPLKQLTHEVITLYYRSPEILLNATRYSWTADVWSLGCIIAEMAIGQPLMYGDCEIAQLFAIFQALGTPDDEIWPGVTSLPGWKSIFPIWPNRFKSFLKDYFDESGIEILTEMLSYNPAARPSVRKALRYSYFDDVDKTNLPAIDGERKMCPYTNFFYSVMEKE